MKKSLLNVVIAFFAVSSSVNAQSNIAAARGAAILSNVTVKGVVINGPEMGVIRYLQDHTGGISAYSSGLSGTNRGDSIQVNGPLTDYKALLEISTTTLGNPTPVTFTALGTGVTQTPSVITAPQFGENVEGRLIKFVNVTFVSTGTFSNGVNYNMIDASSNAIIARVTSSLSNLMGTPIPTGPVNIVGVGSQFCAAGGTCATGYQLLPRDLNDITPYSATGIKELNSNILNLSVYPNPTNSKINFKLLSNDIILSTQITDALGRVVYTSNDNNNVIDVNNLPNGIYNINVASQNNQYKSKFAISK